MFDGPCFDVEHLWCEPSIATTAAVAQAGVIVW